MSAASTARTSSLTATLLVAFMWLAYFLNYSDRQAVFAMFPSLRTDLGMTDRQLGLTGALFLWVYALGCPIAGQLADRFSKRRLVVLSLVIWSLVTAATGLAGTAMVLLALRAVMGISESLFMPTAIALTANAHPPELRSRAIATLTTAQIAGTVAGSWFGGWMADLGHWRGAFYVLGAIGVLYALPYYLFLHLADVETPNESRKPDERLALMVLMRIKTYILLCGVFPIFVFGLWLLYGWLPNFLHDKFRLNQTEAAFNATVYLQGATALGMLVGGYLADALYRRTQAARYWLLTASFLLCAPFLHGLGNSDTLATTRWAAVGFGWCSGLFMGNIFPAAFEVVPYATRASAVGILNLFGGITSGFATLFGGLWKKSLGMERLISFTAIGYAVAGMAVIVGILVFFSSDHETLRQSNEAD